MHFLDLLCLRRIFNVLLTGSLVLFLSCQSDPMAFDPLNGYEYQFHSFPLNIASTESILIDPNIGISSRLYTGIINNHEVYTLLRLLPEIISTHDVCSANSSKDSVSISLTTKDTIATQEEDSFVPLFDAQSLYISLINLNQVNQEWIEEANINSSAVDMILEQNIEGTLDFSYTEKALFIDFPTDSITISKWCANNTDTLGLLIRYLPNINDENILSLIEFYSSENTESKQPKLNFSYKISGDTTYVENRYAIAQVIAGSTPGSLVQPYMIIDSDSANWGTVYAFNIPEDDPEPVLSIFFDSIQDTLDDVISGNQINSELELIQINITRNTSFSAFNEMDSITFWLDNAVAYISDEDPGGDNYTKTDTTGKEGNEEFDWDDRNNDGKINYNDFFELYDDYGTDGCVDSLECGDNLCITDGSCIVSPLNLDGTENNGKLDWIDNDDGSEENGLWDNGEGERWWDYGTDWCPDSLESGGEPCIADGEPCNCLGSDESYSTLGPDPNGDNVDPFGDDWHEINNPDSTEGNKQWDPGEPFHDWGSDMVPGIPTFGVEADQYEGNGELNWIDINDDGDWDDGEGEQWFDTGSDGKYNVDEVENYSTNNRTEGNFEFNTGERFLDCGEGENQFDLNIDCENLGDNCYCLEDSDDDYNIDPNHDNALLNENGTQGNNLWNEGEDFKDLGFDQLTDSQEALYSQVLTPNNDKLNIYPVENDKYSINLEVDSSPNSQPALGSAQATIWISDINKIQGEHSWEIIVSVYTTVALKGFQFQLKHTPLTWKDTIPLSYQSAVSQIEENKLYQDITLLPNIAVPDDDSLKNNLMVNYSTSVVAMMDFTGLKDTLEKWEELIFSHEYSNLVLYIDTTIDLDEDMSLLMKNSPVDNSKIIINNITLSTAMDSVVIPMGSILQDFENGTLESYMGIYLESEGTSYNFSQVQFHFGQNNDEKNPRLNLTYRRR